ncbi:MAG: 4-hydroxybutyryl-CoA dehydratase / vinylacetyl-CoA delta-isomerase [Dehalococcoidales bacterium]|nr:4-hydroxybutyryl-CoA dehydratase / vinylacetyl-CoA delta-isomerase [Dehalococcoidales bacterium]
MTLKNAKQYIDSLRELSPTVYILGERVKNAVDHPMISHQVAATALTYELAHDPKYKDLLLGISPLTGDLTHRFLLLMQSTDDLVKKVKMLRLFGQKTGTCFMRCTGLDVLNAAAITTYEIDQKYGTEYHQRLLTYLKYLQQNDLVCHTGVTDVKGDRSLRPADQPDPDMYLHVVEERKDGIVVRGAKAHQSGSLNAHEVLVAPSREMRKEDRDYAISFAIPTDAKGMIHVYGRGSMDTRELDGIDLGNIKYSKYAPLVIYDNVFVPWERVFMYKEYEFAGPMVRRFAAYHRQSHGGCKSGVGDVLAGAAATIAEYNGVPDASHIRDKITEMIHMTETMYGLCLASSTEAKLTPSGVYFIDSVLANASKLHEGKVMYEMNRLLQDIAGGLVGTLPSEKDLDNPEIGPLIDKYMKGIASVPAIHRMRMFRLIEKLTFESRDLVSHVHGGGSPEAHRMTLLRETNMEEKKKLAKDLAGINE